MNKQPSGDSSSPEHLDFFGTLLAVDDYVVMSYAGQPGGPGFILRRVSRFTKRMVHVKEIQPDPLRKVKLVYSHNLIKVSPEQAIFKILKGI